MRGCVQPGLAGCLAACSSAALWLLIACSIGGRAWALDQVDLDRRGGPVLEREAEDDRQHRGESVDPEDPRRLA